MGKLANTFISFKSTKVICLVGLFGMVSSFHASAFYTDSWADFVGESPEYLEQYDNLLSIDTDNHVVAVGMGERNNNRGRVSVYHNWQDGNLTETIHLNPPATADAQSYFGSAVAMNGHELVVAARRDDGGKGAMYVYSTVDQGASWTLEQRLAPESTEIDLADLNGFYLDYDGRTVASANNTCQALVFDKPNTGWENLEQAPYTRLDFTDFSSSCTPYGIKVRGDYLYFLVKANFNDGETGLRVRAYIYERNDQGEWGATPINYLEAGPGRDSISAHAPSIAVNDTSVAIVNAGLHLAIFKPTETGWGAHDRSPSQIFNYDNDDDPNNIRPDYYTFQDVAAYGDVIAVNSPEVKLTSNPNRWGRIYIYRLVDGVWTKHFKDIQQYSYSIVSRSIALGSFFAASDKAVQVGQQAALYGKFHGYADNGCLAPQYYDFGSGDCVDAEPGHFVPSDGAYEQTQCRAGYYNDESAQTTCKKPSPGYYADENGSIEQKACEPGFYSDYSGARGCKKARPGHYVPNAAATEQIQCAIGYYQDAYEATECIPSPLHTFVNTVGAKEFINCPINTTTSSTASTSLEDCTGVGALSCSAGYYYSGDSRRCEAADAGYYVPDDNMTFQIECENGSYSANEASTSCTLARAGYYAFRGWTREYPCQLGTFTPEPGRYFCEKAPIGYYVDTTAATEAIMCPAGTTTSGAGRQSIDDCIAVQTCDAGSYFNVASGSCVLASAGFYVAEAGAVSQTPCPTGHFSSTTGATSCTAASPGYFVSTTQSTSETACSPGSYSPEPGASSCNLASEGHYVALGAATSQSRCTVGFYAAGLGNMACTAAPEDTYIDIEGAISATACPDGTDTRGMTASISIDACRGENLAPVARDYRWRVDIDHEVSQLSINDVLTASVQDDGETDISTFTIINTTLSLSEGDVSVVGDEIVFRVGANATLSSHNINYSVSDDEGASTTGRIMLFLSDYNESPIAYDSTIFVYNGDATTGVFSHIDPDRDPVQIEVLREPSLGDLQLGTIYDSDLSPYQFRYRPRIDEITYQGGLASDSIEFRVFDGNEWSDTAIVSIHLAKVDNPSDRDGDGLLDDWEENGLRVQDTSGNEYFVDLPAMGADPDHKDIFLQLDRLLESSTDMEASYASDHYEENLWMPLVRAFANAPVNNPNGEQGIRLHIDYGPTAPLYSGYVLEENYIGYVASNAERWGDLSKGGDAWDSIEEAGILPQNLITVEQRVNSDETFFNWREFNQFVNKQMDPARRAVFRYGLMTNEIPANRIGLSQGGLEGSSSFVISADSMEFGDSKAAKDLMHELGHTLGLGHGGRDNIDLKPYYLSVMNSLYRNDEFLYLISPTAQQIADTEVVVDGPLGIEFTTYVDEPTEIKLDYSRFDFGDLVLRFAHERNAIRWDSIRDLQDEVDNYAMVGHYFIDGPVDPWMVFFHYACAGHPSASTPGIPGHLAPSSVLLTKQRSAHEGNIDLNCDDAYAYGPIDYSTNLTFSEIVVDTPSVLYEGHNILRHSTDWDRLVYRAGSIGDLFGLVQLPPETPDFEWINQEILNLISNQKPILISAENDIKLGDETTITIRIKNTTDVEQRFELKGLDIPKYFKAKSLNEFVFAPNEMRTIELDVELLESVKKDLHLKSQIKAIANDDTVLGEAGFSVTFTKDFSSDAKKDNSAGGGSLVYLLFMLLLLLIFNRRRMYE